MRLSPRLPWYGLLSAAILVPVAVGVTPLSAMPLTLNIFVQPKLIVLLLATAVALAGWALMTLRDKTLYLGRPLLGLAAFVVAAGLSTVFALDPRLAFFGDFEQGVGTLVIGLCALTAFLATQLIRDGTHLEEFTSVVILTAAAIAVIGLLQQVFGVDILGLDTSALPAYLVKRGYGTLGNSDTYGAYLVLPALLALHRLVLASRNEDRVRWGACFFLIVTSCVASQTRGPLVGLAAGGLAYWLVTRRARAIAPKGRKKATPATSGVTRAIVVASVVAGVLVAMMLTFGLDWGGNYRDFVSRFGSLESLASLGGRIPLWTSALKLAAAHPVLGLGPDSFRLGWYGVRRVADLYGGASLVITDPHSVPLLLVATMGLVGLAAAGYLLAGTVVAGFRTTMANGARAAASDYLAWLCGAVALSVTLLSSMLTSVLLFMLFIAFGVLLAPSLRKVELRGSIATGILRGGSLLAAASLAVFGLVTALGQITAVTAQGSDADTAYSNAARAASIAPWDTEIRHLRYSAMVQRALDHVFNGKSDGETLVADAKEAIENAERNEPHEYVYPYRSALLLIGSGQKLGTAYTEPGIEAGLRGLRLYPNSLELRTGISSGYLALKQPEKAEALLGDVWDAAPTYKQSGLTYAEALSAADKPGKAREVLSVLKARFPGDTSIIELETRIPN